MAGRPLAAIVLAGGHGRRLGGVDKPGLMFGGRSLAGAVAAAAIGAGASQVVVVGPDRPALAGELSGELAGELAGEPASGGSALSRARIEFACERPPGAGPVPALRTGLGQVAEPWLLLLAADLPFLTATVLRDLVDTASLAGGAVLADDQGRPQWLVSCWPTAALRIAIAGYSGQSLRGLLASLPHAELAAAAEPGEPPCWLDCDTPEDLAAAERLARNLRAKEPS